MMAVFSPTAIVKFTVAILQQSLPVSSLGQGGVQPHLHDLGQVGMGEKGVRPSIALLVNRVLSFMRNPKLSNYILINICLQRFYF